MEQIPSDKCCLMNVRIKILLWNLYFGRGPKVVLSLAANTQTYEDECHSEFGGKI